MSEIKNNPITDGKIFAIIRGVGPESIVPLVDALYKGGIRCAEVTLDQSGDAGIDKSILSIQKLSEEFGDDVFIGAGTVMSAIQAVLAKKAGAKYIVSPNTDREVVECTKSLDLISVPGAMTPSEIVEAYSFGADIVKLYPADFLGTAYLKSVKAPLSYIPIAAVGGLKLDNFADFLKSGASAVGIGGSLISRSLIEQGRFEEIAKNAAEFVAIANSI